MPSLVPWSPHRATIGYAATYGVTGPAVHDQLARDIAEIEAATAALLKAEPELESWSRIDEPAARPSRAQCGCSSARYGCPPSLVTAGAVVAIANFAG